MKIQIPKPCQEKWQAMNQVENGGFCGLCQRVVPDFTKKSDKEIVNYIKKNHTTCGRFRASQINRDLVSKESRKYTKWHTYFLGIIAFIGIESRSYAQENSFTEGKIVDSKKIPIAGGSVFLKQNTSTICITDADGKFQLSLPNDTTNKFIVASANNQGNKSRRFPLWVVERTFA